MVIVELPAPPEIDVGLKLTVTPLGAPVADNEIAELKPPTAVVAIVELPEFPVATLTAVGEADTVKFLPGALAPALSAGRKRKSVIAKTNVIVQRSRRDVRIRVNSARIVVKGG